VKKAILAAIVAGSLASMPARTEAASIILNGSFETNTAAGTLTNLDNAAFTATVANATGFGAAHEIDLVTGLDFGIAPQDGNWKLGLHTQSPAFGNVQDGFSLSLSTPVVAGQSYSLSFYGALLGFDPPGTLQIGLSSSANSFGSLIFSATPFFISSWDHFTTVFVAPSNALFLTVRTSEFEGYAFIDNITLEAGAAAVPEPATLGLLGVGLAASWRRIKTGRRRA
jgi:hypothetical protein